MKWCLRRDGCCPEDFPSPPLDSKAHWGLGAHDCMNLRPLLLRCFLLLLLLLPAGCATKRTHVKYAPCEPSDACRRRFMNEHIIAINQDGLAIEPCDYLEGRETPLQKAILPKNHAEILRALGLQGEAAAALEHLPTNGFYFRDLVLPMMFDRAKASGKPVMIYVHGGMNYLKEAIERAENWLADNQSGPTNVYPIFVCWPSGFTSAYWQHLMQVRNGVDVETSSNRVWPMATMPLYLATDVATSLVRLPRTVADLSYNSLKGSSPDFIQFHDTLKAKLRYFSLSYLRAALDESPDMPERVRFDRWLSRLQPFEQTTWTNLVTGLQERFPKTPRDPYDFWQLVVGDFRTEWENIRLEHPEWRPIEVSIGNYDTTTADTLERRVMGWGLVAPKLLIAGVASGAGTASWGMMRRRIDSMYQHERSFHGINARQTGFPSFDSYRETNPDIQEAASTGVGAMSVFFRSLVRSQKEDGFGSVTLVGHSMGAMVLNRGLREFPDVRTKDILYMAAACSVKDFSASVVPYMARHDSETHFHNLCLHPRAELRERAGPLRGELAPRGSLLVWIDTFLDRPDAFSDRVLGHFENAMIASHLIPARLQHRVHMISMDAGEPQGKGAHGALQLHGDFKNYEFWKTEFKAVKGWDSDTREQYLWPGEMIP